ncbi:hypothetical protein [Haliangium sp.]|uniref:hypothetical protein n=1 Tax=Haliangium sp. TaxID=2663208 RepID=UPI003D12C67F
MNTVVELFHIGGFPMYWVTFFLAPALALPIVHLVTAKRLTLTLALCAVLLPVLAGAAGTMMGRARTDTVVDEMGPESQEDLEAIRRMGYREASVPLYYGAGVTALGALVLMVAEIRRRGRDGRR